MPTYVFKGRNRLGEVIVGERLADSRDVLRQLLRREQVMLTSVKEKGREIAVPKFGGGRKKVKAKELAIRAIKSAIQRDAASGDGIDVLVVSKTGHKEESIPIRNA